MLHCSRGFLKRLAHRDAANTTAKYAFILVSSADRDARRKLKSRSKSYKRWLLLTTALGVGFLGSQLLAWRQLVGQGIYVSSNPHSSFFYLLTATHGLHLLGGLLAVAYLLVRTTKLQGNNQAQSGSRAAVGAVTLYWHFMDGLWIYLFLLLFFWR